MMNAYIYDGTFEGLLTAVFDAWTDKYFSDIRTIKDDCLNFIEVTIQISTETTKSERIIKWIKEQISINSLELIYRVHLSEDPLRGLLIYEYLKLGQKIGKNIEDHLSHPIVNKIMKIDRKFSGETHSLYGFIRFETITSDILYARVEPDHNQLEIVAPFFADRYYGHKWIIHDIKRGIAALFDGSKFIITDKIQSDIAEYSEKEKMFTLMWKDYLNALTIKERINIKYQKQKVPLKRRNTMTEFYK